jgi:hypothetical protein
MRSACLGTADVLVVMDVAELTFTIRDLDEVDGPGAVVLCATHIDRLRAPVGWDLVDTRGIGSVIPMPERPVTTDEAVNLAKEVLGPIADVEPIRPKVAMHPLELVRTAVAEPPEGLVPDTEETPLLARAFLGVHRHPAAGPTDAPADPFSGHDWDQSDVFDEPQDQPRLDPPTGDDCVGQLTFGGEPDA